MHLDTGTIELPIHDRQPSHRFLGVGGGAGQHRPDGSQHLDSERFERRRPAFVGRIGSCRERPAQHDGPTHYVRIDLEGPSDRLNHYAFESALAHFAGENRP